MEGQREQKAMHGDLQGAIARITYQSQGKGVPLVLLRAGLWRPLNGIRYASQRIWYIGSDANKDPLLVFYAPSDCEGNECHD
jgi:hypothetical protein